MTRPAPVLAKIPLVGSLFMAAQGFRRDCRFRLVGGWHVHRWPLALVAALLLAGCNTCPERLPEVVKVPVRVTVPVPAKLTEPCPVQRAESRTVEAVVGAYNANIEHLEACNRRLGEIRALPTGEVKP